MIARNFFWLSAAQLVGLLVGLFSGIYARRVLGVAAIGEYTWCLALVAYFSVLVNPGLDTIAKRDTARDPSQTKRLVSQLLALAVALALAGFLLLGVFAYSGLEGPTIGRLLALSSIALLFLPFNPTWLLQAHERMIPPAIVQIVIQVLRLPVLVLLVREPGDVDRYILLAYPFQLGLIVYLTWYASRYGLVRWGEVRPTFRGAWPLLKEALPLGASQGAILLYYNFDTLLLGFLTGDRAVGIYSTAYGVMLIPTFLSGALTSAYFPQLSRAHGNDLQSATISSDFLRVLVWMGMPLAALGWAFGRYGIVLLYGHEFAESGPLLEWLSPNLALIFFSIGVGQPLTAWGLQRKHLRVTLSGAVVNVVLNCVMIPRFGVWGAVVTTLLAEFLVGIGCIWVRRTYIRLSWWRIVAKPFLVCVVAALIGRHLAAEYPDQWFVCAMLITGGILIAFWISERTNLAVLMRRLQGPEHTGP